MDVMDGISGWNCDADGTVNFGYQKNGTQYAFQVTPETQQEIMREISDKADDPQCELDWEDALYLHSLIREVMAMHQNQVNITLADEFADCGCDQCRSRSRADTCLFIATMAGCCGFWFALFVFVMWGWK